jgi:hypothetical protein
MSHYLNKLEKMFKFNTKSKNEKKCYFKSHVTKSFFQCQKRALNLSPFGAQKINPFESQIENVQYTILLK